MFDGSSFQPNSEEAARGWFRLDGSLIIPRVDDARDIPSAGTCDQAFVLDTVPEKPLAGDFMDNWNFTLEPAEDHLARMDPTWDRTVVRKMFDDWLTARQALFWEIMETASARAFFGDSIGRSLFVTDDAGLFSEVASWMTSQRRYL